MFIYSLENTNRLNNNKFAGYKNKVSCFFLDIQQQLCYYIYMKGGYTMFRKLVKINNNIFEWYFNHKETKLCTFIMYILWTGLILKIFIDLTD